MARLHIAKIKRVNSDSSLSETCAYTGDQLMRAIGIGWRTIQQAQNDGFLHPVNVAGRNVYFGKEVMRYLEHLQAEQYPELESA